MQLGMHPFPKHDSDYFEPEQVSVSDWLKQIIYLGKLMLIIIMYIYRAFINSLSAHIIHTNLNMIFHTHVEHSPIKNNLRKVHVNKHTKMFRNKSGGRVCTALSTELPVSYTPSARVWVVQQLFVVSACIFLLQTFVESNPAKPITDIMSLSSWLRPSSWAAKTNRNNNKRWQQQQSHNEIYGCTERTSRSYPAQ